MRRICFLVVVIVALAVACAGPFTPTLVDTGRQTTASISVEPQIAWTRLPVALMPGTGSDGAIWTVDGPLLDQLRFYGGVRPGGTIGTAARGQTLPVYRDGMSASELAELLLDTVAARGASRVELSTLAPAAFGDVQGFRVDYRFRNADGLELRGKAQGAVKGDRLYLIVFEAAADHYFGKLAPAVDRLMSSAQIVA